tara:strand:+ start:179 stop:2620 length:2442 start_codon:yes stop_codon:yes gene_type:complete
MLYDVIRQLVPTPELIFMAWSQSLDYNIGTSSHTFAAMTAVCEVFGIKIGMWMKKPPAEPVDELRSADGAYSPSFLHHNPMPKRDDPKYQDPRTGEDEYNKDIAQWTHIRDCVSKDDKFSTLPHFMGDGGATKDQVKELVTAMERQRRATSAYRHRCTIEGNSEMYMSDPTTTIEKIMAGVKAPLDAPQASGSSDDGSEYMPLHSSCIMANAVQVSILHSTQAVAQWMSGGFIDDKHVGTCAGLGTMQGITFSKSKRKGACVWNTAWMRSANDVTGWMGFARDVVNTNNTCKIFDLPMNGLRDLVFLLSTRDNNRRCTEEPRLPYQMQSHMAFTNSSGSPIGDGAGTSLGIRMRGIQDSRANGGMMLDAGVESKPRHSYSGVPNVALQRSLDFAVNACRFPAMVPVFSNNVMDSPPVRIVQGEGEKRVIELNTAAALEHTKMIAEGILRCSTHPGLQNEHERFCDDAGGPNGLCCPSGITSDDDDMVTKLPYSYDIMSIALTLDAMSRYYDPTGRAYAEMFEEEYGEDLGLKVKFEQLPHMCLRFVGLKEEVDRRLLSYKVPEKNSPVFPKIEAGEDVDRSKIDECHAMVSITLGHYATEEEVSQYLKSRAGSRAMSGVRGDLFSMETWLRHSHTVLQDRGMVSGPDDVVMGLVADEPYQLRTRVTERASQEINKLVEKNPRMQEAEEERPGDDRLSTERLEAVKEERRHRIRTELYDTMYLPEHLDDLRHCGALRITNANIQRTYHNTKSKKRQAPSDSEEDKRPNSYSGASMFANTKRTMKQGLPSKKKRQAQQPAEGVFSRGQRDSRGRG